VSIATPRLKTGDTTDTRCGTHVDDAAAASAAIAAAAAAPGTDDRLALPDPVSLSKRT